MFASRVTKDITVKITSPEVIDFLGTDEVKCRIRKLSDATLEKAAANREIDAASRIKAYGGDVVKAFRAELDELSDKLKQQKDAESKDPEKQRKAFYASLDRQTVINAGLVNWDCQEKVRLNPDAVADLDADAAHQIHEAICDLSRRKADEVPKG